MVHAQVVVAGRGAHDRHQDVLDIPATRVPNWDATRHRTSGVTDDTTSSDETETEPE